MSEIISIVNHEIRMNSQMDENSFGKTSYNTIVTQKGILAVAEINAEHKYDFKISEWTFSDIKAYDVPEKNRSYVFYCGNNDFSPDAQTVLNIMKAAEAKNADQKAKDLFFEAAFAVCSILTKAAIEKLPLPVNGAGGIIFDKTDTQVKLLFIPEELYLYAAGGLTPEENVLEQGFWVNSTLHDLPALCFYRAVIAYKMLTGKFPFEAVDITERNADILDRKFLPVDMFIEGINPALSKEINKALKLNSNIVNVPGKKQKGKSSEDLTPTESFPLELLYAEKNAVHQTITNNEQLKNKAETYLKAKSSSVSAKRKIRRNTTGIIIGFVALIFVALITGNTVKANKDERCSKGLTSIETIETFYYGINDKDTVMLSNISSGKKLRRVVDAVSNIYVIGKSRRAYSAGDQGYLSPEAYLFYITDASKNEYASVYGVSNVSIKDYVSDLHPPVVLRGDKKAPLTEENGKEIHKNDQVKYDVYYYLLHSEDVESNLYVDKIIDTVTLTYKKDRWIITDIDTSTFDMGVNSQMFKADYWTALLMNDMDVMKTVEELGEKYPWLPDSRVMNYEKIRREEEANDPILGLM